MFAAIEEYREDRLKLAKERRGLRQKSAVYTRKIILENSTSRSILSQVGQEDPSCASRLSNTQSRYHDTGTDCCATSLNTTSDEIVPAMLGRSSSHGSAGSSSNDHQKASHHQPTRRSRGLRRGRTRPGESLSPVPRPPTTVDIMDMSEEEMLDMALRLSAQD